MFAISKTDHFLHTSSANSSWADSLDSRIRKLVKKHLRLPVHTNCAFLHLSTRRGGLGLRSISQAWDCTTITRAIKLLSSSDRTVSDVAWAQLRATIHKRMGTPPTSAEEAFHFLNTPPRRNEGSKGEVRSLWAVVRRPLSRLGVSLAQDEEGRLLLRIGDIELLHYKKKAIINTLREAGDVRTLETVLSHKDQGRSFPLISQHHSSGKYVSFADY